MKPHTPQEPEPVPARDAPARDLISDVVPAGSSQERRLGLGGTMIMSEGIAPAVPAAPEQHSPAGPPPAPSRTSSPLRPAVQHSISGVGATQHLPQGMPPSTARGPVYAKPHAPAAVRTEAPAPAHVPAGHTPPGHLPPARGAGGTMVADEEAPPSRSALADLAPGTLIGQYELIRELGRGGMGVVYLARDPRLGRRVAVKLLQTVDPEWTARFLVEARATAQFNHENIVVIHEVGVHEGSPFMVLEYLEGRTLGTLLETTAVVQPKRAVEIMASVLKALAAAHEIGIVHRDLKPENIFLTDTGVVKVLDFGIAKVMQADGGAEDLRSTRSGQLRNDSKKSGLAGTLAYMSPEQWATVADIDARSDIWAIGIILFEMLAGRRPFEATDFSIFHEVCDMGKPTPALLDVAPTVPVALADAIDTCLQKSRDARYASARALLRDIEPFLPGRFQPWRLFDKGPYTGLRSFQEEDAPVFFGRSKEIAAFVARIHDWPLSAIVGPSGVGKSSFVRAGVVPALRSFGADWEVLVTRPGRLPFMALAEQLGQILASASPEAPRPDQQNLGIRLALEPGYLGAALRAVHRATGKKFVLFVDQFEELYTLSADPTQRRAYSQALAGAADDATSPVRVIVSIRSDFLGRVGEDAQFMAEISRGLFFLGAPNQEGLREALVSPAEMVDYRFESETMVQEMLSYLATTPGALPLLQFTAAQLWERKDAKRKLLTVESYRALGGIAGALASHADRVVEKLTPDARALCRVVFLQLVTAERTRAIRELEELRQIANHSPELEGLLNELVESRLLVVQTGGGSGGATVEIVHESLIEAWLTLRRWLEESHEDSMFLDQLRAAARQWETKRRDPGLLWGGEMAEELERFQRRFKRDLPDVTREFIKSVAKARHRRAHAKRRWTIAGGVILVGLLAAASVALVIVSEARRGAESNARAAHTAKAEAQRRLAEVQEKERQRLEAEKQEKAARARAAAADKTVALTGEELARKNAELLVALEDTESQRKMATDAQRIAEEKELEARKAEERAEQSATELEVLLKRERQRSERLSKQLGSSVVEVLK